MTQIPNILTFARIAVLPFLIVLMFNQDNWAVWTVFILYVFASLTDFFDGYLARQWKVESAIGTFLDPISDKIFVACILVAMVAIGTIYQLWLIPLFVIFIREFLVSGLREFLGPKDVQVPVTPLAKWKTTIQMVAIGILVLAPLNSALAVTGLWLLTIAAILTAVTGWQYLKAGWPHLRA